MNTDDTPHEDMTMEAHRRFLESLPSKVEYELQRLLRSGAVDDTTPLNVLYAVALRNVQILYDDLRGSTARNLLRI